MNIQFKKVFFTLLFFVPLTFFPFVSKALKASGPLSLSFSGAGRAVVGRGAEYHLLNPAHIAHTQGFRGSGFYVFKTKENKSYFGLSLMENSGLPLALSYMRERETGDQYMQLSVASFILPGLSLGLGLSRWELNKNANWNLKAGFLIKPKRSFFSLGFTWEHILSLKGAYKGKRNLGLGLAYDPYEWLHLRADTIYNPDKKWNLAGGVMFTLAKVLLLRFSGEWHFNSKKFLMGGGIGLRAEKIGIDYGLSQTKQKKDLLHTLNISGGF